MPMRFVHHLLLTLVVVIEDGVEGRLEYGSTVRGHRHLGR